MKTSIIVYSINQEDAENKMNELYIGKEERIIKRTKDSIETYVEYARARKWNPNERTIRGHELYVDSRIDSNVINEHVITHLLSGYNDDYNWKEHIHYF